jgi:hypothetical protein
VNTSHRADEGYLFIKWIIVDGLVTDAILGTSAFKYCGIVIDSINDKVHFGKQTLHYYNPIVAKTSTSYLPQSINVIEMDCNTNSPMLIEDNSLHPGLHLLPGIITPKNGKYCALVVNATMNTIKVRTDETIGKTTILKGDVVEPDDVHFKEANIKIGSASSTKRSKIKRLIRKYRNRFREYCEKEDTANLPSVSFPLKPNAKTVRSPIFAKRPEDHERQEKFAADLCARGKVSEEKSQWRANIVLCKKKDGSDRMTIDYRGLNAQSDVVAYPMPLIQEIIANLAGVKYMSKVDFCDGYWAIKLDDEARKQTGFATRTKQYVWNVLPQGYTNSGALFQNAVNDSLGDLLWNGCMPYIDDVIIYSKTFKEHITKLEEFFQKLEKANFFLKLRKCEFLMEQMEFLGHTVTTEGMKPSTSKTDAIRNLPKPTCAKHVKSFLGSGSFYRRYIPNFASRTTNMRKLSSCKVEFTWTEDHQKEFDDIKDALCKEPVLAYPDWNKKFILQTDASIIGFGAVLMQKYENGPRVIEYASKATTSCESRYGISELECAAAMWAVDKFAFYIYNKKFDLITDHKALTSLKTITRNNAKLHRWSLKLAGLDYNVKYLPGKLNHVPDLLSRTLPEIIALIKSTFPVGTNEHIVHSGVVIRKKGELVTCSNPKDNYFIYHTKNPKESWILKEDKVFQRIYAKRNTTRYHDRWYVPEGERRAILANAHDNGHFGFAKSIDKIKWKYFWPGMNRDCKIFCNSCTICQLRKYPTQNKSGLLGQLQYSKVNELLGIDIFSGLPKTIKGNRVILVITDYLSKYTMAIPLKDKKAATVAEALVDKWVTILGFPRTIQSDQGKEFTSILSTNFFEMLRIKKMTTTPYTPKANGMVERFNKVLASMLAKYTCYDQLNWDEYVNVVTFEYNGSVHASTGETPYFMMFGREPIGSTDVTKDTDVWDESTDFNTPLDERIHRINEARKRISKSHLANADRYNKRQKPHRLVVGDNVIFLRQLRTKKNISHKKLGLPGVGPFKIVAINKLGSRITINKDGELHEVNAATLIKYVPRPDWMQDPAKTTVEQLAGPPEIIATEDDVSSDDEAPIRQLSELEYQKVFTGPDNNDNEQLTVGSKVDVHISKTWRHGTLTRKDDSKRGYVKGKMINRWIKMTEIRPCVCPTTVKTPVPKKNTQRRTTRIYSYNHCIYQMGL